MADEPATPTTGKITKVKLPRAVHEIITGKKPEEKIPAGEIITDEVAKKHSLSATEIKDFITTGAVDEVEVLKG